MRVPSSLVRVIIRQVGPQEAELLSQVGELTVAAYTGDGYLEDGEDGYAEHLRDAADRAARAELAAAMGEEGELLGSVTYCRAGTPWAEVSREGESEFRMLAVTHGARGQGVGKALAAWCVQRARTDGCSAVVLSTLPVMHAAHRIYERMGFVRTPDRDWYPQPDFVLLTYRLAIL